MRVHAHGQNAHHVLVQRHQTLHLLHGGGGCVGAQIGVMPLAVLVDLVGHRLEAPVFELRHGPAIVGQNLGEMLDQAFGLRGGQILPRDEGMLVQSHGFTIC